MTVIDPIPLSKVGAVYLPWLDAPPGKILAFASRCATGSNQNWQELQTQMIAVRADGEGLNQVLIAVLPEIRLILKLPAQNEDRWFTCTIAENGPAVDISASYELAVAELAPAAAKIQIELGDIVRGSDGAWLAYVGETMQERFLVLTGANSWTLVGRPTGAIHFLGKLTVVKRDMIKSSSC